MTTPTKPLGPFAGMNNRLPDEKLTSKDGETTYLRSAVNVDFTNAGTVRRRAGSARVLSGDACHSLWSTHEQAFCVVDAELRSLRIEPAGLAATRIADVTPGLPFSYADTGIGVYASNGKQFLRIDSAGAAHSASVPTPVANPLITIAATGALPAGRYAVVLSYVSDEGEEGGTTVPEYFDVPANGRVTLTMIPQLANHDTFVYMTPCNGDMFYYVGSGGSLALSTLTPGGRRPVGLLLAPLPAGTIVRWLNGRLMTAIGRLLFYSEPHMPGLYHPARNYIEFPEPITMVEPCQNGFYLSADQTYWINGELLQADLNPVLPYRAVAGSSGQVPTENKVWWMSERGLVLGAQDGTVQNVQERDVAVERAVAGASVFREENGLKQVISTLFSPQSTVMAARSYMDAEVIRKENAL